MAVSYCLAWDTLLLLTPGCPACAQKPKQISSADLFCRNVWSDLVGRDACSGTYLCMLNLLQELWKGNICWEGDSEGWQFLAVLFETFGSSFPSLCSSRCKCRGELRQGSYVHVCGLDPSGLHPFQTRTQMGLEEGSHPSSAQATSCR